MSVMPLIENQTSKLLEHVLAFRNRRHDAISSNIANASTPGYRAFDIALKQKIDGMKPLQPRKSDPRHMSLGGSSDPLGVQVQRSKAPAKLDGNNVSLDHEFLKLLENRTMYQAGMELMDRWGRLNRWARDLR